MGTRSGGSRRGYALIAAPALIVAGLTMATAGPAAANRGTSQAVHWVRPGKVNSLDCNGWSRKYRPAFSHRDLCADPRGAKQLKGYSSPQESYGSRGRFVDNGHYVGHDEPSVRFLSDVPGSGNTMTYFVKLPVDPAKRPTSNLKVTKYGELSVAPWFGLAVCDNFSYPQNPCSPDSDSNSGSASDPAAAGSAFMELQFYPPGFAPFQDSTSCSATTWCSAITIDSLESEFNYAHLNPNCTEPINFAFLQRNGIPAGPPSPQLADNATYTANRHTLQMRPGDVLKVSVSDPLAGLTTTVHDLTTGQTGYMVAGAGNGFMHTNYQTCAGSPYTFHAEYSTAGAQNNIPWAALDGGVLMQQEIGHAEVCRSLSSHDPFRIGYADGQFTDTHIYDTCVGDRNGGSRARGEGPCNPRTGVCKHASTEGTTGPIACPSGNAGSGQLCEFADGICVPRGTRTLWIGKAKVKETSPVNLCYANRFQNGDLDFDGTPYQPNAWPDGSPNQPTSFRYIGPFDPAGHPYPSVQFETDAPGSEFLCNVQSGLNCSLPPLGARFYPYWTMTSKQGIWRSGAPARACVWEFGQVIPRVTKRTFGRAAQYGAPEVSRYGGTSISPQIPNPEISGGCPALRIKA